MKNIIATGLFLLAQCAAFAQQSVLNGTVTVFNSQFETGKKQYIANAQVEEDYGKSQAATTNTEGVFKLPLVGIKDLEKVFFNVKKATYEVVNTDALQAVAGQKEAVQVYMAQEGVLAENKRKYYQINRTASEKAVTEKLAQLGQQIETLQQNKEANKAKIEVLQAEYARLQENFKKIDETARELAERYAKTNLDDASAEYQRAFRYFQRGLLDSALFVFQKLDLEQTAQFVVSEQNRTAALKTEYETRNTEKNKQKMQTNDALLFKANLHKTKFEFDKTEYCYNLLLKLDSTNVDNLWAIALFLYEQNKTEKAIVYYEKAILNSTKEDITAGLCNELGAAYYDIQNTTKAEKNYQRSFEIREKLAKNGSEKNQSDLAETEMNLGNFYFNIQNYDAAEKYYLQSLHIQEQLAKSKIEKFEANLAITEMNLGIFYFKIQNPDAAEKYYLRSLEKRERLSKTNPKLYESDLALVEMNLGSFFSDNKKFDDAEKYYLQSLEIRGRLSKENPAQFEPDLAMTEMNLGVLYVNRGKYSQALTYYLKSLDIRKRLAKEDPAQF